MCHLANTKLFATRSRTKEEKAHERQYPHISMQLFKGPPNLSSGGAFKIPAPQHRTHASAFGIIVTPSHPSSHISAGKPSGSIIAQPTGCGTRPRKINHLIRWFIPALKMSAGIVAARHTRDTWNGF
jgi:hypothetical protein